MLRRGVRTDGGCLVRRGTRTAGGCLWRKFPSATRGYVPHSHMPSHTSRNEMCASHICGKQDSLLRLVFVVSHKYAQSSYIWCTMQE